MLDVLVVSLGATGGLRAVDDELLASLRRAGASAELVRPDPPPPVRTLMLTDLRWARAVRRALLTELSHTDARALLYSTTTSALLWVRPGAIRFDATAAGNRPGRHGLWQRPLERRRLAEAPLLLPQSIEAQREAGSLVDPARTLVLPAPVEPSGRSADPSGKSAEPPGKSAELSGKSADLSGKSDEPSGGSAELSGGLVERSHEHPTRDIAAVTYAANPAKKGLGRVLDAWRAVRRPDEELVVAGVPEEELRALGYALPAAGVRVTGVLSQESYRALLRRSRVFVCAAVREDYGMAQLEALVDGCTLVTAPSPGPYVALPIARELDGRLVGERLETQLRTALDDPAPGYAERAQDALAPFRRAQVDRLVAEQLLPRLLA